MSRGCPTLGCGGDPRYAAPGRDHISGCKYPNDVISMCIHGRSKDLPCAACDRFYDEGLLVGPVLTRKDEL